MIKCSFKQKNSFPRIWLTPPPHPIFRGEVLPFLEFNRELLSLKKNLEIVLCCLMVFSELLFCPL